ncbi:MAG: methyl-accepting chemotaxis protein [Spirochaetales bacterium]|nr:methyl-accepting chemotaxis protein [Spirochaetales bacterium]
MKRVFNFFKGLKGKIQLVFAVFFIIALCLFAAVMYLTIKPDLMQKAVRELSSITSVASSLVADYTDMSVENHLVLLAEDVKKVAEYEYQQFKSGRISEEEAYNTFSRFILDPVFGRVGETGYLAGVDSNGILAIHPKSQGVDASKYDFMKKATALKNGFIEYEWANVGEEVPRIKAGGMAYFEPWDLIIWASSYKNEFTSLINVEKIGSSLSGINIGKNGYTWVIDTEGNLIFHPGMTGKNIYEQIDEAGGKTVDEIITEAVNNPDTYHTKVFADLTLAETGDGVQELAVYKNIADLNWIVISQIPLDETTVFLRKIFLMMIILAAGSIIIINIIVNLIFSRILAPVSRAKEISGLVSEGDLSLRLEVESEDEIGQMADQFNTVIEKFSNMLITVRNTTHVLLDSVQELSVSSQEISSTSNEQAAAVKEIVSTMEDSDNLSKSIAVKIEEVTAVSNNTKKVVNDGFTIIKETLSKMDEIRQANTGTISGIKMLGEKIESIWEIVNIINGIADQTKIIAFNAELEASAAGDAGKNFQIVATEIRRLADSTVSSTNEIKTKINEIQHSSDRLIISSEEGTTKISKGWELSNALKKLFEDVLSSSEISATSAEHISISIKQQVSAFEQILLTLKQISEGIDNFVISTKATTTASHNLKSQADALNETVIEYKVKGNR